MLNIINSFQNKDGYPKTLYHNSNSTNNIKINTKKNDEFNSASKDDYSNHILQNDEGNNTKSNEFIIAEKTQNIKLNVSVIKEEQDIKQINLEIIIHNFYDDKNIISIQILDNNDPLFFYTLKIDEIDYQQLKKEQSLFIEFKNFSDFIFKMLNNCLKENFNCFITIMKNDIAYLKIEEKNQFRKLNHLTLKLNSLNNSDLKNHINKILKDYEEKYDNLLKQNEEITKNIDRVNSENNILQENLNNLKKENDKKIEELITQKNKDINDIKENNIKQKEINENYIKENNSLKEEIKQLKLNAENMNNEESKLKEENFNLQKNYKELEDKYNNLNIELEEKIKNILDMKSINDELNQEILNYKEQKEELENKNKEIQKEIENKEAIIKNLRIINVKFENKLKLSIKEINKANVIIEKFQNEIKSQKTKINSLKKDINQKIELLNEKQTIIDNLENNITEINNQNESKEKEINSLKNEIEISKIKMKEDEDVKSSSILNTNIKNETEDLLNRKNENQSERESNSDYNPSYFFTFYKKIQNNSTPISNTFIKPNYENSKSNEINNFEEIKTNENSFENNIIYNNISSYQFREIKGNYINDYKKKRKYFSDFPLTFNKSTENNMFNNNK